MLSYINVNLELLFCVAGECRSSVVSVSVQHIAAVCQGYSLGTNIPQFAAGNSNTLALNQQQQKILDEMNSYSQYI